MAEIVPDLAFEKDITFGLMLKVGKMHYTQKWRDTQSAKVDDVQEIKVRC